MHQALPVPGVDVENEGVALPEATQLAARGGSGAVDCGGGAVGIRLELLFFSLGGVVGFFVSRGAGSHGSRGGHRGCKEEEEEEDVDTNEESLLEKRDSEREREKLY